LVWFCLAGLLLRCVCEGRQTLWSARLCETFTFLLLGLVCVRVQLFPKRIWFEAGEE
jgi:hypothetical protein